MNQIYGESVELPHLNGDQKFTMEFHLVILRRIPSYQYSFKIKQHSIVFNYLILSVIDKSCLLGSVRDSHQG